MPPASTASGRPLVTALVAAHDAAPFVAGALASLGRQTVDDLEILVVDDGSTDGTRREVARAARADRRIRLLALGRNRGQAAALNAGLELARGRWLALLDADDEAMPERLAVQLAVLESRPGPLLVGGAAIPWYATHRVEGPPWRYATEDGAIRARSLFKSEVIHGAMSLDLEALRRHRLRFDERLRVGADWALSLRLLRQGEVANVEEVVLRYRIHPGQLTAGMMDDLGSDSTRLRREALGWMGLAPSEDELRTHLAVSPCAYWPFGAHPYFRARRATLREDARRWFGRLRRAAARGGPVPAGPLDAWLAAIETQLEEALEGPGSEVAVPCPAASPRACAAAEPCRPGRSVGAITS
jgi:glycosyltransferase involved in cell wall biosynthesis